MSTLSLCAPSPVHACAGSLPAAARARAAISPRPVAARARVGRRDLDALLAEDSASDGVRLRAVAMDKKTLRKLEARVKRLQRELEDAADVYDILAAALSEPAGDDVVAAPVHTLVPRCRELWKKGTKNRTVLVSPRCAPSGLSRVAF